MAKVKGLSKQLKKKQWKKSSNVHSSDKSVQGSPHNRLLTSKEIKKITSSDEYKKANYKGKTEMLGGKTWTAAEMKKKINTRRMNIREQARKKYGTSNLL